MQNLSKAHLVRECHTSQCTIDFSLETVALAFAVTPASSLATFATLHKQQHWPALDLNHHRRLDLRLPQQKKIHVLYLD